MLLTSLASISALLWTAIVIGLFPSLVRIYRNRQHAGDEWRAVSLFQAGIIVAFNVRRVVMGHDPSALSALHILLIILAIYVLILLWRKGRG